MLSLAGATIREWHHCGGEEPNQGGDEAKDDCFVAKLQMKKCLAYASLSF